MCRERLGLGSQGSILLWWPAPAWTLPSWGLACVGRDLVAWDFGPRNKLFRMSAQGMWSSGWEKSSLLKEVLFVGRGDESGTKGSLCKHYNLSLDPQGP